ncbi:hypothetical protein JW948_07460 [bacterium]|nr:hypothetical protein [bacterium]
MKKTLTISFFIIIINTVSCSFTGNEMTDEQRYGQKPPGKVPEPINTEKYECGFSFVDSDNFYFAGNGRPEGKSNQCDIYCTRMTNGIYGSAANLGNINTERSECVLAVAPDEKYIVLTRYFRKSGKNAVDLCISFRTKDGSWTVAEKLDSPINSPGSNHSPRFSFDGKYFFFSQTDLDTEVTKNYWVRSRFFDEIEKTESNDSIQNDR